MRPGIVSLFALIASLSAHPISLTRVTRVHLNLLDDVLSETFKLGHGAGAGMSVHRSDQAKHLAQGLLPEGHYPVRSDKNSRIESATLEASLSECNVLLHNDAAVDIEGTISLNSLERLMSSLLLVSDFSRDGSSHESSKLLSPTSQTSQCRDLLREMSRRLRSSLILGPLVGPAVRPKKVPLTSSLRFRNIDHDRLTTTCHEPERPYPRHRTSWDSLAIVAVIFLAARVLTLCVEYFECLNAEVELEAKVHDSQEDEDVVGKDEVSKGMMMSNDGQADSAPQYELLPLPEYVE